MTHVRGDLGNCVRTSTVPGLSNLGTPVHTYIGSSISEVYIQKERQLWKLGKLARRFCRAQVHGQIEVREG